MDPNVQRIVDSYRRTVERQRDRDYRAERDHEMDKRWAMGEVRARERHDAWKKDREFLEDERDRQEKGRNMLGDLFTEMGAVAGLNEARGNSGKGEQIVFSENEEGDIGLGVQYGNGEQHPLTMDPADNSSQQLYIAAKDKQKVVPFINTLAENIKKQKPDISNGDLMKVINGSLTANEDGSLQIANEEEFGSTIANFLSGGPKTPEPQTGGEGGGASYFDRVKVQDDNKVTKEKLAAEYGPEFAKNKDKMVGNTFEVPDTGTPTTEKIIRDMYTRRPDGTMRIKTTKVNSPEDFEKINQVGEAERQQGEQKAIVEKSKLTSVANNPIKAIALPKNRRTHYASELVRLGVITPAAGYNLMETGDIRFSKHDLELKGLQTASAYKKYLKAEKDLAGSDGKPTPKDWKSFDTLMAADIKEAVHMTYSDAEGGHRDKLIAEAKRAVRFAYKEMNLTPQNYANPEFRLAIQSGAMAYLRNNGESDFKAQTATPYIKTIMHGIPPDHEKYNETVDRTLAISAATGMGEGDVMEFIDREVAKVKAEQKRRGLDPHLTQDQYIMLIQTLEKNVVN